MTIAMKIDGAWTVLPAGQPITNAHGIRASYETVMIWSYASQEAFGVFVVPDAEAAPAGKVETERKLGGDDNPVWVVTYADAPPPGPEPVPDGPTNSDWRVGLIMWGRFAEVEQKVTAARDSGSVEGQIAWQRWEYANNVYRAELMALRETFGFTADEVDESLRRAAAVPSALAARSAA